MREDFSPVYLMYTSILPSTSQEQFGHNEGWLAPYGFGILQWKTAVCLCV